MAAALAEVLAEPLADPFAREVVAVPAKGVERWLCQQIAAQLGVAANIDFPSPARLVELAIGADEAWAPDRLAWDVLAVLDDSLGQPWAATLTRHLTGAHREGRRYATAEHIAGLFAAYAAQRPQLLEAWAAGANATDDLAWQSQLWRLLCARLGTPSPPQRLAAACDRLRAHPESIALPSRISLFGTTRMSTDQLAVVQALAAGRDVHLWIPHPSPAMWRTLAARAPVTLRSADSSALAVRNPLLASLSRDVRELQVRLGSAADVYHPGPELPGTVLGRLQRAIRDDTASGPAAPRVQGEAAPSALDDSVQVHACHGPARQVEVLRECLLHAFADDPDLQPRDVLVMCPDIETYAPLVRAAFGQGIPGHPAHGLRVRLADRALQQTNSLLQVLVGLLESATGRVAASELLDLAARPAVRRRFGFDDDDLERLRDWSVTAGARWGLGRAQRADYGLGEYRQNTFSTAVDRILVGVSADESSGGWLDLVLPLDDVESNDIALAGRFAEFVDRLMVVLRDLRGPQSGAQWCTALLRALDLLTDVDADDAWMDVSARREIAAAVEFGAATELRLADVRALFAGRLSGRPTRANFRTGELTVCTMVPMRSVPHRVVALLGLDDDVFPRAGGLDGDDVLAREPLVGERDPRSEDRQLLLDAVLSAGDRLLLFYTGADPVSGAARPPAIPLSEIVDAVTAMVGTSVVRHHPLQPFDARNFDRDRPFSFDTDALAGARAAQRPPLPVPPLLAAPLPPVPAADVELADLIAFVVHPTQGFLRQRLGIRLPQADDTSTDSLDVELAALTRWDIGDRLLAARLAGADAADFRAAEWRRGTVPPFTLGALALADIEAAVEPLVRVSAPLYAVAETSVDVDIALADGRRLTGTVGGLRADVLVRTGFSRLGAKQRLTAWLQLLAVAATLERPLRAVTTGRGSGRRPAWRSELTAPPDPVAELEAFVALRDRGLRELLGVAAGTAAVYAERTHGGSPDAEARTAAAEEWSRRFGEREDAYHVYAYGPQAPFEALAGPEFPALAHTMWHSLLNAETLRQP